VDIFKQIENAVTVKDVIERYYGKLNRANKVICPFHPEKTPSLSVDIKQNIWKCFGCGAGGDAVSFVAKLKDIEPLSAAQLIAADFGININDAHLQRTVKPRNAPVCNGNKIKEYITDCVTHANETDFFARRGLNNETVKRFNLGYDPLKCCAVFPYSSKLDYYQTRNVATKEFRKPSVEAAGQEPLWGYEALNERGAVFVVESPICALSIYQCGGTAIALCGVGGVAKFVREITAKKSKAIFILALDNDTAGIKAQEELARGLCDNNIRFVPTKIGGGYKDPNEFLCKDPNGFDAWVKHNIMTAKAKFKTAKDSFTVSELMQAVYRPPKQIVENLIVEGLTLLCAPQKIGKSWLVLDLCFSVASGSDFWAYRTAKAEALYYSLEDPAWRIKDRTIKLFKGQSPPNGVHFITESDKLGDGFLEHLVNELTEHPDIKMVVIDTLQRIRKVNIKNNDIYGHDYEELVSIKKFAESHKIAIVVVHHTRKTKDDTDPFINVLGTGGITGAVDTMMVIMKKKRGDKEATLSITGRDIAERDLIIEWNNDTWRWMMSGDAEEMQEKRERAEYENDPFVITVKVLTEQNIQWRGTVTELLQAVYDITKFTGHTPQ
jgi:hypothetical protein